jgi:hypothetical protein
MPPRHIPKVLRACVEVSFIIFLFYSNLLMGEFTVVNGRGKTWAHAFADIFTLKNFEIALVSAVVGFIVFEGLRKRT